MNQNSVLRTIDANFNRTREALRVIEDILRFSQADRKILLKLRTIRHYFTSSYISHFKSLPLSFRDVEKDEGKENKPYPAKNLIQILKRNLMRAGEGLRTIEECSRISAPDSTKIWQKLRFDIYAIEKEILLCIQDKSIQTPFFAIHLPEIDKYSIKALLRFYPEDSSPFFIIKCTNNVSGFVSDLRNFRKSNRKAIFIVYERVDIAFASDADGVHLNENSISSMDARRLLQGKIIGKTVRGKINISEIDYLNYISLPETSFCGPLLTKRIKNIKLYIAVILESCREIKQAKDIVADGVILKLDSLNEKKLIIIEKAIRNFYGEKA